MVNTATGMARISPTSGPVSHRNALHRTDAAAHVTVLPDTFPVSVHVTMPEVQSPESDTSSPDRRGSDLTEPFRLREYAPGDSLRQIHWKLSQKTDSLMVRELGLPVAEEVLLLLDTSTTGKEDAADALDAAMTASSQRVRGSRSPVWPPRSRS